MIHREIDLDEESDQILASLAQDYNGDLGKALGDLLHAHQRIEALPRRAKRRTVMSCRRKRSALSATCIGPPYA
ncbi:MAG TPA: hypothetical protein VEV85_27240 [Bryobacteraceae bacterium]|nr:hypothetical protein [Bryobacteraceae bacterium]